MATSVPSPTTQTLRELCDFLAPRVSRPVIRPWPHLAGDCLPAGAFLTVRALLADAGADVTNVTPSSPLPGGREVPDQFVWRLALAAPGRCPMYERTYPPGVQPVLAALAVGGLAASVLGLGASVLVEKTAGGAVAAVGMAAFVTAIAGTALTGTTHVFPAGCRTFRDLAYLLAGQTPRRRIQPTT